jgi:hypothetical protein
LNACDSNGCVVRGMQSLQFELSRQLGFSSPLSDWCHPLAYPSQ